MGEPTSGAHEFCLRFFAEARALGVTDAVISPGSRSTPLAVSARRVGLGLTIQLDERVAAFHALGMARATRRPVVLICTSGTAGANYHPAVIEAHHSGIPLIVCTADRPPELRRWGAGQTIDQHHLYGSSVRWFHEVPVAGEVPDRHAASLALRAVETARRERGPVHLDWPFREPLEPDGSLEPPRARHRASPATRTAPSPLLAELGRSNERGLVVVGPADLEPDVADEIVAFGTRYGWPILADPASGLRTGSPASSPLVISTAELLLQATSFTDTMPPRSRVVVRVGPSPTSKAYRLWLERARPDELVLVDPGVDWADPTDSVTAVVDGPLPGVFGPADAGPARQSGWAERWSEAEATAAAAATVHLVGDGGELGAVHQVVEAVVRRDEPANLVASSSMPIRDLDAVLRPTTVPIRVIANRGANGIDGVISTASGVAAASGLPTYALVGDIAAVHDLGGLTAAARLELSNLVVVVIDNDAGGIFSLLPVARAIEEDAFEELFATPHGTDLVGVARALGCRTATPTSPAELGDAVTSPPTGAPAVVVVRTPVAAMVRGLNGLREAVAAAFE